MIEPRYTEQTRRHDEQLNEEHYDVVYNRAEEYLDEHGYTMPQEEELKTLSALWHVSVRDLRYVFDLTLDAYYSSIDYPDDYE